MTKIIKGVKYESKYSCNNSKYNTCIEKIIQERAVNSLIMPSVERAVYVEISSETQNSVCVVSGDFKNTLSSTYEGTINEEDYFIPFFLYAVEINRELSNILSTIISQYNKSGEIVVDDMEGFCEKINAVFKSYFKSFDIDDDLMPDLVQTLYNYGMLAENPVLMDLDDKPKFTLLTS